MNVIENFFHSYCELVDTFFSSFNAIDKKENEEKKNDENRSLFSSPIASFNHVRFHQRLQIYINISNKQHSLIQKHGSKSTFFSK